MNVPEAIVSAVENRLPASEFGEAATPITHAIAQLVQENVPTGTDPDGSGGAREFLGSLAREVIADGAVQPDSLLLCLVEAVLQRAGDACCGIAAV